MEAKQLKLTFLLAVLMSMVGAKAFAYDFVVKNADGVTIYYGLINNSTEVEVSHWGSSSSSYSGVVNIPKSVTYGGKTYPVTSIGSSAFSGCSGLTSVTIPNSVTSIGYGAFANCRGLTSVTIPNSVKSIGSSAFAYCSGLTSVTIPNSVTSIGLEPFFGCTGLTEINVDKNNTAYSSIDGVVFNKSQTELVCYPGGKQGAYTIPNSVKSIGESAFYNCTGLTSVIIPNSVTSIGNDAFRGCSALTSVTIPNSVTSIGNDAFYGCSALTSVTIGNSVTSIGDDAFRGCSALTSVTIPNSVTSIGDDAFRGCSALTSVTINSNAIMSKKYTAYSSLKNIFGEQVKSYTIGKDVTSIGGDAFYGCSALTSVTIGNSVTSIGGGVFSGCTGLTSITIPNSVTSIGSGAFYDCTGLTKVIVNDIAAWCNISFGNGYSNPLDYAKRLYRDKNIEIKNLVIPDGVTTIKKYTFINCRGLISVTIPNSVTSIGEQAFYYCTGLTSVTIPNSVTSVERLAFAVCTGLTSVTIGNSVKSIGESAFYGCSALTSVTIGNSVTSIGDHAFHGCNGLTSVTIPNSVTSIGDHAFHGCNGLTSVTIPNSVTSIGSYAFYGCSGLTSVTIPNSVTSIGSYAFYDCTGLTSVTIPNSVTSIGWSAFRDCRGLTTVTIPNSVTSIGWSAFLDCSGLTDIYCHIEEPLTIASNVFNNVPQNTCTLHVPIGSKVKYQAADVWKDFLNIVEDLPGRSTQTITWAQSLSSVVSLGCEIELNAVASTGLPITYTIMSGNDYATLVTSGEKTFLRGVKAGIVVVEAKQVGNNEYQPVNVVKVFTIIEKLVQEITWNQEIEVVVGDSLILSATSSSGLPVTYTIKSGNDYATLVTSGEKTFLRGVKAGTVVVEAKQVGNNEYLPASVEKEFTISELRTAQTITWSQIQAYVVGLNSDIELTAVASSGLPITYVIKSGSDCATLITSGDKTSLRGIKIGTVVIEAKQDGNSEYQPASVEKEFTISELRTAQTITWSQIQAYVVGLNSDIELTAVASSGLPITYVIKSGSDCATLITSGDKTSLRGIKIGTVVIEAKQDGNSEYQPASVEKEFTINKKTSQRITWSQEIEAVVGDSLILSATSSSGLPVAYRALDEDYCSKMEIKQNAKGQYVVHFSNRAPSIIEAYQEGNDTYNAAEPVRKYYNTLNSSEINGLMCIDGIYYKYTDNTCTALKIVRGFKQYEGNMIFPAVVNGLPVTKMDSDATYICPLVTSIEFKEGHSRIEGIHYDMALEKVILPSTTSYIGYLVFFCCPKLKDIYLYAATPPEVASSYDYNQWNEGEGKTLYVPRGTRSAYENADFWKNFTIVEVDVPTGIVSIDNSQSAIDNDVWFTLSGVRLNGKPTKAGIYIVNGKKVVVK